MSASERLSLRAITVCTSCRQESPNHTRHNAQPKAFRQRHDTGDEEQTWKFPSFTSNRTCTRCLQQECRPQNVAGNGDVTLQVFRSDTERRGRTSQTATHSSENMSLFQRLLLVHVFTRREVLVKPLV